MGNYENELEQFIYEVCYHPMWEEAAQYISAHPYALDLSRSRIKYLTGEAKAGSITTTSNDNRRTYNQQSTISFEGSNFYINDRQDAYALAVEIASLTRRQQRGKGLRMA